MELLELLEGLAYFGAFWMFALSPNFRRETIRNWRTRSVVGRLMGLGEAGIAVVVGLGPFLLLVWLLRATA